MREGPDGRAEPGLFDQLHQRDRPQHPGQGGEAQVRAGRQTRQGIGLDARYASLSL